jgi:hypothetical protein
MPTTIAPPAQEVTAMTRIERRTAVKLTASDPALLAFFVAGVFVLGVLAALGAVGLGWLIVDGIVWLGLGGGLVVDTHRYHRRVVAARRYAHVLQ